MIIAVSVGDTKSLEQFDSAQIWLSGVERPIYDTLMAQQLENARAKKGEGDLDALLHAGDTWAIS